MSGYLDFDVMLVRHTDPMGEMPDAFGVLLFEITEHGYDGDIIERHVYGEDREAAEAHVCGFYEQQDREARGVRFEDYFAPYGEAWAEEQMARAGY